MTDDPERLLRMHTGVDPLERELLESMQRVSPPAGARDQAWSALAAQLAVGTAASSAAAPSTAAAAKVSAGALLPGALGTKAALAIAAGGIALGGYLAVRQPLDAPHPHAAPHVRERPAVVAPAPPPAMSAQATPQVPAAPAPAPEEPAQVRPSKRALDRRGPDRLAAESALLVAARAQLRAGDARGASASLERLAAQFPHGVLLQEREVLAIELLAAQGDVAGAQRRARAFVSAHPESPHSAKLRQLLNAP